MLLLSQGCRLVQSLQDIQSLLSDMERASSWQDQCHKQQEGISRLQEDSAMSTAQQNSDPEFIVRTV